MVAVIIWRPSYASDQLVFSTIHCTHDEWLEFYSRTGDSLRVDPILGTGTQLTPKNSRNPIWFSRLFSRFE